VPARSRVDPFIRRRYGLWLRAIFSPKLPTDLQPTFEHVRKAA